ncbi:hypothetical protein [Williamsia sterculiae]|uniref:Uncharacterized protein n=1 Tax=Williamsia sterculiae TaxID=1344003 RepID=A0A1N7HBY4_9NOCA|nr:hypothetical protein [Williamsia sterculiae]SIS22198.1 hypothetical protein SAMN05445060_3922 [Williamsia sterculiae]
MELITAVTMAVCTALAYALGREDGRDAEFAERWDDQTQGGRR